ncbi:MAG TPA: AI-2E family transporter [Pseudolabrys sp.]|nr:AI-2E family transporter [Pseudolabrys sp.]
MRGWHRQATVEISGPRSEAGKEAEKLVDQAANEQRALFVLDDARPVKDVALMWRTGSQAAVIGIFLIALIAGLNEARPLLLPITSAFIVGLMLGPLSSSAQRHGVPTVVTAIVLWLLVIVVFYGVIVLLSAPVVEWIGKAPQIADSIKAKLHILDRAAEAMSNLRNAILPPNGNANAFDFDLMALVRSTLSIATPAIGQVFIFFGVLFFFLLGRTQLRHMLIGLAANHEARLRTLRILNDVERNLTNYLSVVALINLCIGLAAGLIAYFVGLSSPVAWAVLGFVLNFIPYIGALIMEAALFAVGLVSFATLTHAIVAPLVFLGVATLEGHFITPSIMGARLTLNPLTVFLSLIFWTWLWGPVGAFLAVPLLIVALVAIHHLFPRDEPPLPE